MRHPPLNKTAKFRAWRPFNPGLLIDTNPTLVRTVADEAWCVFCRYGVPPIRGQGAIWAVRVDADLEPCGVPIPIIANGTNPRAVRFGDHCLVVYSILEHDDAGQTTGHLVALAEFDLKDGQWIALQSLQLPKDPISGPARPNASDKSQQNWVPFTIDEHTVGLIYSHEPWNVITMRLGPDEAPRLSALFQGPAISWDYGNVQGGTPPVPFDDENLITFYHSSQMVGSKTLSMIGACVFAAKAPYAPTRQTREPLLVAPYHGNAQRFAWSVSASTLVPLGCERAADGFHLLCGRDDGEIVSIFVSDAMLKDKLDLLRPTTFGAFHDYRAQSSVPLAIGRLLYVPEPIQGISELPVINFLKIIAGYGRTFVDVGAHIGFYAMALAPGYETVICHEPSRFQFNWLAFNKDLNRFDHITCRPSALSDQAGELMINVLSTDGGCNTLSSEVAEAYSSPVLETYAVAVEVLDGRKMTNVDLLKIDVEGFELPVLRGAIETINASRPVILIEVWVDLPRRSAVQEFMSAIRYTFEPIFPLSPELVLCLPAERRAEYDWFI